MNVYGRPMQEWPEMRGKEIPVSELKGQLREIVVEWLGRGVIKLPFKYEDCDVYIVTFSKIIIAGPIFVLDIDGEFIDALSHDVFTELMELYEDFCRSITGIK